MLIDLMTLELLLTSYYIESAVLTAVRIAQCLGTDARDSISRKSASALAFPRKWQMEPAQTSYPAKNWIARFLHISQDDLGGLMLFKASSTEGCNDRNFSKRTSLTV